MKSVIVDKVINHLKTLKPKFLPLRKERLLLK